MDYNHNGLREPHERSAVTDDTGAYTIGQLVPGDHLLALLGQPDWRPTEPAAGTVIITVTGNGSEYGCRRSIKRSGSLNADIIEGDIIGDTGSKCPFRGATGKRSGFGYRGVKSFATFPVVDTGSAPLGCCRCRRVAIRCIDKGYKRDFF